MLLPAEALMSLPLASVYFLYTLS